MCQRHLESKAMPKTRELLMPFLEAKPLQKQGATHMDLYQYLFLAGVPLIPERLEDFWISPTIPLTQITIVGRKKQSSALS
jgi:hypothetical protein